MIFGFIRNNSFLNGNFIKLIKLNKCILPPIYVQNSFIISSCGKISSIHGIEIRSKDLNIVNDNTNDNFIILLTECLYRILNEKRFDSLNGLTHLEPGYKSDVEEIINKIKNFKKG